MYNVPVLALQNLGEAEYVVALFMYMCLLGYPADKISILTTYNGQKHLIRDIINRRCGNNPLIGRPNKVVLWMQYVFIFIFLARFAFNLSCLYCSTLSHRQALWKVRMATEFPCIVSIHDKTCFKMSILIVILNETD